MTQVLSCSFCVVDLPVRVTEWKVSVNEACKGQANVSKVIGTILLIIVITGKTVYAKLTLIQ